MNTITIEKKWSGENLTNQIGGDGPGTGGPTRKYVSEINRDT